MEIARPRIDFALQRASRLPVTVLSAPAGSGKTFAIRSYLRSLEATTIVFTVRPAHTSLSRFARGLAATLEGELPKVAQSLAIAHERAMQSPAPADVLAAWVAEHLGDVRRTIVIDDFHHCEGNRDIAAFVSGAIERTRATTRWILGTRTVADLPLAVWLACGDADLPIDRSVLDVDSDEGMRIASRLAPELPDDAVARIATATSGSIGRMVFALATARADRAAVARALEAGGGDAFERLVDGVLVSLAPADRRLLDECATFPDLDDALLRAAGFADGPARVAALRANHPQLFADRGVASCAKLERLVADLLIARLGARGAAAIVAARSRAGRALEACDRVLEALATYIGARDFAATARLLDARGLDYVDAGYGDAIVDAIDTLDPIVQNASPAILATKAMVESRLGRFDLAESWFQLALERVAEATVRDRIRYHYGTHLLRFFRQEAIELLGELARDAATVELRCYANSALGPALVFAGRTDDAAAAVERTLAMLEGTSLPHLRARVLQQAAYVALYRGDGSAARTFAEGALAIASEHGYFDIATAALHVLYNAASDLDDDPVESLALLDAVADCAAKSGSLVSHLLALIAKLEIVVERGDESAIARLDTKLKTLDVRASGRAAYEALLPSQALRASWTGDFEGAYHLLAATAVLQWSDDRKALRWAEIAVYAAAAGRRVEATSAIGSSRELLGALEPSVRRTRTQLFLALAAILLGRVEAADDMLALVEPTSGALSTRMSALQQTVVALRDRYRGERNHEALIARLRRLERQHFGGVARMLEMLPIADNATARWADLSEYERGLLETLSLDDADPSVAATTGFAEVIRKLGCVDGRAVARAIGRRATFVAPRERAALGGAR